MSDSMRIIADPAINCGEPTPSNSYLTVEQVLRAMIAGEAPQHMYREYGLSGDDIRLIVQHAMSNSQFNGLCGSKQLQYWIEANIPHC